MAIIGQSKNKELLKRITEEGLDSKFRELDYLDVSNTEPLISGYHKNLDLGLTPGIPGLDEEAGGSGLISDVQRQVTARIDDTARISKLLTTRQGIKWEAHNAELAAIQNGLESKRGQLTRDSSGGFWSTVLGQTLRNIGSGLLDVARVTAETLAQTAVAGTGEHFSAWYNNTYLKSNITAESLLGIPGAVGGAAAEALASGHVTIHRAEDGTPELQYNQLPYSETDTIAEAQRPGESGSKLELISEGGSNYYGDGVNQAKNYKQRIQENLNSLFGGAGKYNLRGQSEDVEEAQKPGLGKSPKDKDTLEVGPQGASYGMWRTGEYLNENRYLPDEGYGYLEQVMTSGSIKKGQEVDAFPFIGASRPEYIPGAEQGEVGPWKPEGVHALLARTAQREDGKGPSDHNYNSGDQEPLTHLSLNANTRVDNGRIEMIPFWIRAITPNGDPLKDNGYLFFEANLDSYSDNYDATWQGIQYVGRADKFWTYEGFDRQINFAFKMVAHSKSHLKPIYNRLNGLLSMTAPNYGSEGIFMRGTLAEITIGDLLSRQLGFIKSVGLKWETDYMWETDEGTIMVPHVLDVSVQFTPIHKFVPETRRRYFELANASQGGSSKGSLGEAPFGLFTANGTISSGSGYKLYDFR